VHEQVRESLTGYIAENTTEQITFDEWNGDKIAGLILKGILREEILPNSMRSSFQKAVAMVDEPDVAYQHFTQLAIELRRAGEASVKARLRSARQLNICLWILFIWARNINNLEAAYRTSELTLLSVWDLSRPIINKKNHDARALNLVLFQVIELNLTISSEFLESKVMPYTQVRHGISMAINSQSSLDVNLALFEVLGRISLLGLWIHWLGERIDPQFKNTSRVRVAQLTQEGLVLIRNNPSLLLPISDYEGTDIALFLQLWLVSGIEATGIIKWLQELANRLIFSIHTRGRYPSCSSEYRELAEHPYDRSDEYFKEATAGSTLIPLITAWLHALGQKDSVEALSNLVREELEHCTLQLWTPDASSEVELYVGNNSHGRALCDLPLVEGGCQLLLTIEKGCHIDTYFEDLSANKAGFWPIVLVACHHYKLPIPPGFWINSLVAPPHSSTEPKSS